MALGFSLTIPPGPMNALIASVSVRSFRTGFLTGLGAMSADGILGALVYVLDSAVDLARVIGPLYLVGSAVMVYFGVRVLRQRNTPVEAEGSVPTFGRALALGVSNPFQILWWLTAGVAFAYVGGAIGLGGLFGAIAIWVVAFPLAVHRGTRRHPGAGRAIAYGSAAILLGFAVYFAALAAVRYA